MVNCVLLCENTVVNKNVFKNFFYYILNIVSMRHKWTKKVKWRGLLHNDVQVLSFRSDWVGNWQLFPADLICKLSKFNIDFIIKFGMYLLKDPDAIPSKYGVFSFHHGDPSKYRGRPAGFYEILNKASNVGIIVQRLNNGLDTGEIFAFGLSKVFLYSYKETLVNAYGNSVYLLEKALRNAITESPIKRSKKGTNYKLPSNSKVTIFFLKLLINKFTRLLYGFFIEKRWVVGLAEIDKLEIKENAAISIKVDSTFPLSDRYSFFADPMPFSSDVILCEAMDKYTANGVILAITSKVVKKIDMSLFGSGHFSYPFIVNVFGKKYLLPEMSNVGSQRIGLLGDDLKISNTFLLKGLENFRLKDPTLFFHKNKWWLFAGRSDVSSDLLFLWHSEDVFGPYLDHGMNPIVIDVNCARPAGPIFEDDGILYRLGQNNSGSYGNGVTAARILELDENKYSEQHLSSINVENGCGPHTLCNFRHGYVLDYYFERIGILAFYLRFVGAMRRFLN
jgi:hypothetical protein